MNRHRIADDIEQNQVPVIEFSQSETETYRLV